MIRYNYNTPIVYCIVKSLRLADITFFENDIGV